MSFKALVLHEADGKVSSKFETLDESRLPEGEVTVAVEYSTLNLQGRDGALRHRSAGADRPHVPGIDFAGAVTRLEFTEVQGRRQGRPLKPGGGVGEMHWGGYAERAQIKADWLVRCRPG